MNHTYYVTSTTPEGDTDDMEGKWRMIAPDVQKSMTNLFTRKLREN